MDSSRPMTVQWHPLSRHFPFMDIKQTCSGIAEDKRHITYFYWLNFLISKDEEKIASLADLCICCVYAVLIKYRDGIKSKATRLGWGEAHNIRKACIGITKAFKANLCT